MLKLNSQYAQTYLKQGSDNKRPDISKGYGDPVISNGRPRSRLPLENDFEIKNEYNYRDKYTKDNSKNDQSCNAKNRGILQKGEHQNINYSKPSNARQISRYHEPPKNYPQIQKNYGQRMQSSHQRIKDKSPIWKEKSADPTIDSYRQAKMDRENQERPSYSAYSKYNAKTTVPLNDNKYLHSGKTNFIGNHNKRNEQIKNRILREQDNYGNSCSIKAGYDKNRQNDYAGEAQQDYYAYLNNETPTPYMHSTHQQEMTGRKQDYSNLVQISRPSALKEYQWKASQQASHQKGSYNILSHQLSQQLPLNKKNYDELISNQQRFDRPSLVQRKQIIKKSIQNTPERGYQGCKYEPGSSDRKKSLIEKSQMLQQKLKKLSTQYPTEKETPNYQPVNKDGNQQEQKSGRKTPVSRIVSSYNRGNSCLRNNSKNTNFTGEASSELSELHSNAPKNGEGLRSRSPISFQENGMRQGNGQNNEAIDKIAKLNQKINERIQSIISNYANK